MPTYEYECEKCKGHFEVFQSITAPPLCACPKCSGTAKRLIGGGAGVIFKGPGFYATDYKKKSPKASEACPLKKDGETGKSCPAKEE